MIFFFFFFDIEKNEIFFSGITNVDYTNIWFF